MRKPESLLGFCLMAGFLTGLFAFVAALAAGLQGDWIGAGMSLVAAALAFGLTANAMLRT